LLGIFIINAILCGHQFANLEHIPVAYISIVLGIFVFAVTHHCMKYNEEKEKMYAERYRKQIKQTKRLAKQTGMYDCV